MKAFLTRTHERYRPPYGKNEVEEPRQCLFIGTTNRSVYIKDETGARRTWPVECGEILVEELGDDREQLFAEAVYRYRKGEHRWPDRGFEAKVIAPQQERRRESDAWEPLIEQWLADWLRDFRQQNENRRKWNNPKDPPKPERLLIADVAAGALDLKKDRLGRQEQLRIAEAMRRAGWQPGRRTGEARWWVPVPDAPVTD